MTNKVLTHFNTVQNFEKVTHSAFIREMRY